MTVLLIKLCPFFNQHSLCVGEATLLMSFNHLYYEFTFDPSHDFDIASPYHTIHNINNFAHSPLMIVVLLRLLCTEDARSIGQHLTDHIPIACPHDVCKDIQTVWVKLLVVVHQLQQLSIESIDTGPHCCMIITQWLCDFGGLLVWVIGHWLWVLYSLLL